MAEHDVCIWCGRHRSETGPLLPGRMIMICRSCVSALSGRIESEEYTLSEMARKEIDAAVHKGFQAIARQLDLGPLQESYQKLVHVKFKEEPGSPTFQEVFEEFKKGVENEVASDDYQCRYDLAIAYHEMGLSEDAFREITSSLRGALENKDYDKGAEIISALLYFHPDSARALKAIQRVLARSGLGE